MQIRRWRLHVRSETTLEELAREINPVARGWINYFGRFHPVRVVLQSQPNQRLSGAVARPQVQAVQTEVSQSARPEPSRQTVSRTLRPLETCQAVTARGWTMGAV
ncbi:group II intron maturase-specific domain-containing protein [Streptomyces fungicidicus]|uniref:group II intron maturase-specific domain-containing protein n=1 Tax=Streptomyces fungicidicus TaxID=68203 RepID=UPI0036673805